MTTLCFIDCETTGLDPERHEVWEVAIILRETGVRNVKPLPAGWVMADDIREAEYVWQLPVDLARADQIALNIGHFRERRWEPDHSQTPEDAVYRTRGTLVGPSLMGKWAQHFADLTWGAHMIGCVPSFDTDRFLERLLRAHGACPGWHYQPIDVETLAVGSILGSLAMMTGDETVKVAVERGGEEAAAAIRQEAMGRTAEEVHSSRFAVSRKLFLERASLPWDSERLSSWFGIDPERYERHSALGDAQWARDLWDAIWEGATQ